jgi:hypothetical protein
MSDIIGFIGVTTTVIAYLLLQTSFFKIEDPAYSLLNAVGSLMILYSLWFHWNLSCAIIETFWLGISLYGAIKAVLRKKSIPNE